MWCAVTEDRCLLQVKTHFSDSRCSILGQGWKEGQAIPSAAWAATYGFDAFREDFVA